MPLSAPSVNKLLLILLLSAVAWAKPLWVQRVGSKLVDETGQPVHLRGINLGNWYVPEGYMWGFEKCASPREIEQVVLELLGPTESARFWREYRQNYITNEDLDAIAQAGFNAVRVPLHYGNFDRNQLDWLVEECGRRGLWVLPDLHAAPAGQTGTNIDDGHNYPWLFVEPEAQRQAAQFWQDFAYHYADEPTILGYELLNEPIPNGHDDLKSKLLPVYQLMGDYIRYVDSRHLMFLDGAEWAGDFSPLKCDWDPQLVYAVHHYWGDPEKQFPPQEVPWVLTESGENTDAWVAQFRRNLDRQGIGWFFWPYKKMKTQSCLALIPSPQGWDQVVAYADAMDGDSRRKIRPAQAKAIFEELLHNLRSQNCQWQSGYHKALID